MPKELLRSGVGVVVPRRQPLSAWRKRSTLMLLTPAWWRALLILDMMFRMFGVCVYYLLFINRYMWPAAAWRQRRLFQSSRILSQIEMIDPSRAPLSPSPHTCQTKERTACPSEGEKRGITIPAGPAHPPPLRRPSPPHPPLGASF